MGNLFRCAGGGESLNCIAKPYNANETYNKNDVVLYNNILYICTAYSVTGEWDSSKWKQTTLNELSESNPNIFYGIEWLDDEYDSTAEYNTNDTCMHRGLLYLCLEDGVTGEWDKTKWKRTYLLDCTKLNSNLKQINIQKIVCSQRMGDIQCNVFLSLDTKDLNYFSFEKFSWSNCGFLFARITDANNNVIKSFAYGDTNVIVDISSYDSIYIGMGSFNANVDYAQLIMHNIKVY